MTSASRTIGTKTKEAIADFEQKDGMPVNGRWRRETASWSRRWRIVEADIGDRDYPDLCGRR